MLIRSTNGRRHIQARLGPRARRMAASVSRTRGAACRCPCICACRAVPCACLARRAPNRPSPHPSIRVLIRDIIRVLVQIQTGPSESYSGSSRSGVLSRASPVARSAPVPPAPLAPCPLPPVPCHLAHCPGQRPKPEPLLYSGRDAGAGLHGSAVSPVDGSASATPPARRGMRCACS